MNDNWRKFFKAITKTPKRMLVALVAFVAVMIFAANGGFYMLLEVFVNDVFKPLLIVIGLCLLLLFAARGGKKKRT